MIRILYIIVSKLQLYQLEDVSKKIYFRNFYLGDLGTFT